MEDLVEQLAELHDELQAEEDDTNADETVIMLREGVASAERQWTLASESLENELRYHDAAVEQINEGIDEITTRILDEWDGEKKTLTFGAGTLKFRTTKSLDIHKPGTLLNHILSSGLPVSTVAEEYIKGFNLTTVRKYLEVLPVTTDVAELIEKTTVKLEAV